MMEPDIPTWCAHVPIYCQRVLPTNSLIPAEVPSTKKRLLMLVSNPIMGLNEVGASYLSVQTYSLQQATARAGVSKGVSETRLFYETHAHGRAHVAVGRCASAFCARWIPEYHSWSDRDTVAVLALEYHCPEAVHIAGEADEKESVSFQTRKSLSQQRMATYAV